ncbi:MAG: tetratricopeptide repeat protein [Deltaproteobacteria bacterium]|nr:tetratricopeptide repeat protein [Deltaproteobacteria bacterium]
MAAEQPDPNEIPAGPTPDAPMNRKERRANAVIKRRTKHKEVVEEIQQPDQFQQQGRPFIDWVLDHVKELGMAVGAVIVLLFVWGLMGTMSANKAQEASEALFKARRDLPALNAPPSDVGAEDTEALGKALTALSGVIDEYDGTPQADQARVDAGGIAYRLGKHDEALGFYEPVASGKSLTGLSAQVGKAYVLEAKGDFTGAGSILESLRGATKGDMKAQATLDLARVHAASGDKDKAKGLLATFEEEFPDSLLLPDAQARLASLQ